MNSSCGKKCSHRLISLIQYKRLYRVKLFVSLYSILLNGHLENVFLVSGTDQRIHLYRKVLDGEKVWDLHSVWPMYVFIVNSCWIGACSKPDYMQCDWMRHLFSRCLTIGSHFPCYYSLSTLTRLLKIANTNQMMWFVCSLKCLWSGIFGAPKVPLYCFQK